ncbi:transposase family protein, partial [Streptomyces goshikiensis]|uniref:transposase family protein n=1 Tax=Streptomyces goshikiensis TaxID=1942 RepID=UPI0036B940B6
MRVDQLVLTDTEARVAVRSRAAAAACSGCGQRSSKVHCYYKRTLADRPVAGRRVRIELRMVSRGVVYGILAEKCAVVVCPRASAVGERSL